MQVFDEFVSRVVKGLESARLDYAFTGALAASFYGVPRTTVDADVLVNIGGNDVKRKLVLALKSAGLVVNEGEIDRALESDYRIASFKDRKTAHSVDVLFSDGKLEKRSGTIAGVETFFQSPEGLVLAKLRMIKATMSKERVQKDVDDVKAILKFTKVDTKAIKQKAKKESTLSLFEDLRKRA